MGWSGLMVQPQVAICCLDMNILARSTVTIEMLMGITRMPYFLYVYVALVGDGKVVL